MKQLPFSIDVLTVAALLLLAGTLHAERLNGLLADTKVQESDSVEISENSVSEQENAVESSQRLTFSVQEAASEIIPSAARPVLCRNARQAAHCADFHGEITDPADCVHLHAAPRRFCSRW